jgi:hypothetical protein
MQLLKGFKWSIQYLLKVKPTIKPISFHEELLFKMEKGKPYITMGTQKANFLGKKYHCFPISSIWNNIEHCETT